MCFTQILWTPYAVVFPWNDLGDHVMFQSARVFYHIALHWGPPLRPWVILLHAFGGNVGGHPVINSIISNRTGNSNPNYETPGCWRIKIRLAVHYPPASSSNLSDAMAVSREGCIWGRSITGSKTSSDPCGWKKTLLGAADDWKAGYVDMAITVCESWLAPSNMARS